MHKIKTVFLISLTLLVIFGCKEKLTKKVQITNGVTVLMPDDFEKLDANDGQIMFNSKIGNTSFRAFVFKDMTLDTIGIEKIKDGMKFNVTRFIEPIKGKILKRTDLIINKMVQSDFEYEIKNASVSRSGFGRFLVKKNEFVGFVYEANAPETSSGKALRESFFNSIQIEP